MELLEETMNYFLGGRTVDSSWLSEYYVMLWGWSGWTTWKGGEKTIETSNSYKSLQGNNDIQITFLGGIMELLEETICCFPRLRKSVCGDCLDEYDITSWGWNMEHYVEEFLSSTSYDSIVFKEDLTKEIRLHYKETRWN